MTQTPDFGGVVRRRDIRGFENGFCELTTPQHVALVNLDLVTVAFRDKDGRYYHEDLDEVTADVRSAIEEWIPKKCEYPRDRHRVNAHVLATICSRERSKWEVMENHKELWSAYPWGNDQTRDLCELLLENRLVCIEIIEYCRGLSLSNSAFLSVSQTEEHRTDFICSWVNSDFEVKGRLGQVIGSLAMSILKEVAWDQVYGFFRELAALTPVSRLPASEVWKRRLSKLVRES